MSDYHPTFIACAAAELATAYNHQWPAYGDTVVSNFRAFAMGLIGPEGEGIGFEWATDDQAREGHWFRESGVTLEGDALEEVIHRGEQFVAQWAY